MSSQMTIGKYVSECEMFKYSRDYFDIIKESHQLNLMSIQLDALDYINENNSSELDTILESVESNEDGFFKKIIDLIKKILGFIVKKCKAIGPVAKRIWR